MLSENREIKSSLFADLFADDEMDGKRNFLSLYNAIHGSHLKFEETRLERKIIPQSVFKSINNDISMLVNNRLVVFIEHQSTINNNMPLRLLEYFVHILYGIVDPKSKYKKKLVEFPTPEFYVFYNGKEPMPRETVLKLSDSFMEKQEEPFCEVVVKVKNIGGDGIEKLPVIQNCSILKEYCQFMEIILKLQAEKLPEQKEEKIGIYETAVRQAIENGILSEYLKRKSTEVINMFLDPYDYDMDIAVQREEAYENGFEKGEEKGEQNGRQNKAIEDATNLIKEKISPEIIARCVGLPLEEVLKLEVELKK